MRVHGTLAKWNDERGFGFVTPAQGSGDVFIHISAFPRDGTPPRVGELISFEFEADADGKRRALRVMRPGGQKARPHVRREGQAGRKGHPMAGVVGLLALIALAVYAGPTIKSFFGPDPVPPDAQVAASINTPAGQSFRCDGRTHCTQMRSCAEATYFIQHCPNTKMDGNGDGVPCEQQWCN